MKVYALKNKKEDKFIHATELLGFFPVKLFTDKEKAECFCPFNHEVVECYFMNETEFADYTKQVRKEVVQEIRNKIDQAKLLYEWKGEEITMEDLLDQIQGEDK